MSRKFSSSSASALPPGVSMYSCAFTAASTSLKVYSLKASNSGNGRAGGEACAPTTWLRTYLVKPKYLFAARPIAT